MTTKPIFFKPEMVQAILRGQKTETRRLIKAGNHKVLGGQTYFNGIDEMYAAETQSGGVVVAPFQKGDVLWVRETWDFLPCITCGDRESCGIEPGSMETADGLTQGCFLYRADGFLPVFLNGHNWRPSIHMPKKAARIFLRVDDVRAERLQEITDAGAWSEGCGEPGTVFTVGAFTCLFAKLWDNTVKNRLVDGWFGNPWVWVIRFRSCEKPQGWVE